MSDITGSGGGDINVAHEIAGLKELINSGDTGSLTLIRIVTLLETALDRIWQLEQQHLTSANTVADRGGP